MATKAPSISESHPDLVPRWMGNVAGSDRRTPDQFSIKARHDCWWWCGHDNHEWFSGRPGEHRYGFSCPSCSAERKAEVARILSMPAARVPEIVSAWRDPQPIGNLTVADLCGGVAGQNAGRTYSLRCPHGHKLDTVVRRFILAGCPWCRGKKTRMRPKLSLAEADPELAALFHPEKNEERTPESISEDYRKPLWWKSVQCCGYEWQEPISERTLGRRPQAGRGHYYCPVCRSVWGSLAWLDPGLAAEWHEDNELTAWHVKPFSSGAMVAWRCATNPDHVWKAAVIDRSSGRLCPQCSTAGTSKIEQAFLASACSHDAEAIASTVGKWRVDVLLPKLALIIEYDGVYWHGGKQDTDLRKTRELLRSGFRVARIRENDLGQLLYEHPRLLQVAFWPAIERVEAAVSKIVEWAAEAGD